MKIAVLLLLSFSPFARADWTSLPPQAFRMAGPPAAESLEEKRDHEVLRAEEKQRLDGHCVLGNYQTLPTFTLLYGPGTGILTADLLSFSEYASVRRTMKKVFRLTANLAYSFKNHFRRPRPYQTMKDLNPCLIKPGYNDSYPSGHAALGAVGGCLLAKRFPAKAFELKQQGRLVGELRVIGGVHHPSDILAGQELAQAICVRLLGMPTFRREFGMAN